MGIFADMKAIADVQKIKRGNGTANLSIAQITGLLINLPDAEKNLPKKEFNQVYDLFKKMRKCKTKMSMDSHGYLDTAIKIIKEFDKIAPYELYSGGNQIEFSFMMSDIRGKNYEKIRELRKLIATMEEKLKDMRKTIKENETILAEAFSDDELRSMVAKGEFPADKVKEYIQERKTLEYVILSAPMGEKLALEQIQGLKDEIQQLENG